MEELNNITLDYLDKLDNGLIKNKDGKVIRMPDLTYDKNFKVFFKSNEIILKRFLNSVLHLDLNIDNMKVRFIDKEILESKINTHSSTYDYFVNINDNITLDIEMNRNEYETVKYKSFYYQNKQVTNSLKSGDDYHNLQDIQLLQLNLNAKDSKEYGEDIICYYSLITNSIHINSVITYLRYLDYYRKIYYNKFIDKEESDYWLAALTAKSFREFYEMLTSFLEKSLADRIIRDVIRLSMEAYFTEQELINLRKQEEMDTERYFTNKGIEEGISKGKAEGKTEGAKEKSVEIAKNMLDENISAELISKLTGITKEELENL